MSYTLLNASGITPKMCPPVPYQMLPYPTQDSSSARGIGWGVRGELGPVLWVEGTGRVGYGLVCHDCFHHRAEQISEIKQCAATFT